MMIKLWHINVWFRYTGFRVAVVTRMIGFVHGGEDYETKIGVIWVGLPGSQGWQRWQG